MTADHLVWKATGQGTGSFVEAGTLVPATSWSGIVVTRLARTRSRPKTFAPLHSPAGSSRTASSASTHGTNKSLTIEAMTVTPSELQWVTDALD